jgi:hypothetical protein
MIHDIWWSIMTVAELVVQSSMEPRENKNEGEGESQGFKPSKRRKVVFTLNRKRKYNKGYREKGRSR